MNDTAIVLGTFDGVHTGHKEVIKKAKNTGLYTVCVAFQIPPKYYFNRGSIILTDKEEKNRILNALADEVYYLDFQELRDISAEDFFYFLKDKFSPKHIVCGYDYTFGKNAIGDCSLLSSLCQKDGIELTVCPKVTVDGIAVSSSKIRELLLCGQVEKVKKLLGRNFSLKAKVTEGDKRGRTMGFPTINQLYPQGKAEIKRGVYLTHIFIKGKKYYGMTNVGYRPTFPTTDIYCETNLFDFEGDLYNKKIRLYFDKFLRDEKKFSSLDQLISSIKEDKKNILKIIKNQ